MVKTVILNKALLLYMKKRRKTWKTSFTFLVVFRASGAPHVRTPCTSGNWTLAERGAHMPYLTARIMGSKPGCIRSQEIPWHFDSEGHHWGCCRVERIHLPTEIEPQFLLRSILILCACAYMPILRNCGSLFLGSMQMPLFVLSQHAILAHTVSLFTMTFFMSVCFLRFSNIL